MRGLFHVWRKILDIEVIKRLQSDMRELGLYDGEIDGKWGSMSSASWDATVGAARARQLCDVPAYLPQKGLSIAWSAKVSAVFVDRVLWIREALQMPETGADWLMAAMAWETGERFTPDVKNGAGSGAVGLIQFMPKTAIGLGTTTAKLAKMSAEDQLNFVYRYFLPYKGRIGSLSDLYMAILWPAGIGKTADHVLWDQAKAPITYLQNKGLDVNGDKRITKGEASGKVQAKLDKGLRPENRRAA